MKNTIRTEVGVYGNDQVGFVQYFEDGTKEQHIYTLEAAEQLMEALKTAIQAARKRPQGYTDDVKMGESVKIGLTKGGEDETKKIH